MIRSWLEGKSLCYLVLGLLVNVRVPGGLGAGACPGGLPQVRRHCLTGMRQELFVPTARVGDLGSGSADSALRNRREGSNFCKFSKKVLKSNCWKWLGKLTDYNQHRDFFPAHQQCRCSSAVLSAALLQPGEKGQSPSPARRRIPPARSSTVQTKHKRGACKDLWLESSQKPLFRWGVQIRKLMIKHFQRIIMQEQPQQVGNLGLKLGLNCSGPSQR